MLEYLLTMNGKITSKDLTTIYNKYNEKTKYHEIIEEKIIPLIDKKILLNKGYTRKSENESRILEDDIINMYGTLNGTKTYDSVLGSSITIPYLIAEYIDVVSG